RRHTRFSRDWSSDVCSSDLVVIDTGFRIEGVADILNDSTALGLGNLHGRTEGILDFTFPGGASIGFSAAYDGIGSDMSATSARRSEERRVGKECRSWGTPDD